jgi:orotate phosphoribosyltransferase
MAFFASYKLPLLAAAALVAPATAIAQDQGTRIFVTGAMQDQGTRITVVGAMQDQGTRITVVGAMQDQGTRITVVGAMQDQGTRITVVGAARDRAAAAAAEDAADSAVPELPIVYEDEVPAQAAAAGGDTGNGKTAPARPTR